MLRLIPLLLLISACSEDPRPVGRYSHVGVLDHTTQRLHIAGGSDLQSFFVDAWSFDLERLQWSAEAPIPQATHRAIAVNGAPGEVLVYGGTTWEEAETDALFSWSLGDGSWDQLESEGPEPRYKHAAAWDGEQLWVMGGRNNDGDEPVVYDALWSRASDGQWSLHESAASPGPLFRQGMAWDSGNHRLWVYGGIDADGERSDALYSFEPESETWTLYSPEGARPLQKASHSLVWSDGALVAWGGHATDTSSWRYDIATNTWTERAESPSPLPRDAQVTALSKNGETLYIVGGDNFEGEGNDFLSDVWAMDVVTGAWTQLKETGYGEP
jgi:N-acetylneuraminic acid mutarotase